MQELINTVHCCDCLELMKLVPDNTINLTLTSPPYDNLRNYNGYSFEFEKIAKELFRITKEGGVLVWVVGDSIINRSESGTSFRQALYFLESGFKLHDTMIFEKNSSSFPASRTSNRYTQIFEYMFVFSKGVPKCNLLIDKPNKNAGLTNWGKNTEYTKDGMLIRKNDIKPCPDFSPRNNIWKYSVGFNKVKGHPAVFPDKLAIDHIKSWSNKNDIVFDPFVGSGTTVRAAIKLNRKYLACDISQEYINIVTNNLTNII